MTGMRAGMTAIWLTIAMVALAACNGNDETETPTATMTAPATAEPTSTVEPTATPTPSLEELADEVADAYLAYLSAYSDAVLHLDISLVEEFVAGTELESIRQEIESLRADEVALRIVTEHDFVVVDVSNDSALISDEILDNSFYVDPTTLEPPEAEGSGDIYRDLVTLELIDGRWLVTSGSREQAD